MDEAVMVKKIMAKNMPWDLIENFIMSKEVELMTLKKANKLLKLCAEFQL